MPDDLRPDPKAPVPDAEAAKAMATEDARDLDQTRGSAG
jgi:hypothetical protein